LVGGEKREGKVGKDQGSLVRGDLALDSTRIGGGSEKDLWGGLKSIKDKLRGFIWESKEKYTAEREENCGREIRGVARESGLKGIGVLGKLVWGKNLGEK